MHFRRSPLRVAAAVLSAMALGVRMPADEGTAAPPYRDASAQVQDRVRDLLGRMTLEEKIGQITGAWIHLDDIAKSGLTQEQYFKKVIPNGVGDVAPLQRLTVDKDVAFRNQVQKFLVEETRLGIPAMFHDEGCHGVVKPGASSFPSPIGLACSWDTALAERIYNVVASEMRSRGAQLALTPVVDVARDPRWGRFDETMGEDPFLNSRMGAAVVRGLQGSADGTIDGNHVISTLKHFSGHGTPEGGLNKSPSVSTPRILREVDFLPFAYIIRTSHPGAVMPSYNEIDGVPSHASQWLLRDVLRGEFGFTGFIPSDYGGIGLLYSAHHVAGSLAQAGALALRAGVQMELPSPECYSLLQEGLGNGTVTMKEIDDAAGEVLALKFRLGLFERPYADLARAEAAAERPEARDLALEAARESIVLLKNDGILPLSTGRMMTIAVIGPNADVARLGSYSGMPSHSVTLLEGIRSKVGAKARILYAQGCMLAKNDTGIAFNSWNNNLVVMSTEEENRPLIEEARRVAAQADVVILAVGESEAISRESWSDPPINHLGDADTLELRGSQGALAEAVLGTGKPMIVYLNNSRPLSIRRLKEKASAIIEGWCMGEESGTAAADILFGDVSPSGKLTVSFPSSVGDIPAYYSKKPFAGQIGFEFGSGGPLWSFGDGLSYTTFKYENPRLQDAVISADGSTVASVDVVNTGGREADEIVQLYVHQDVSSVTRAVEELKGFQRIHLKPGERKTVSFPVTQDALAMWGLDMKFRVEPGTFKLILGGSLAADTVVTLTVRG
jgi:beta-glucosidase